MGRPRTNSNKGVDEEKAKQLWESRKRNGNHRRRKERFYPEEELKRCKIDPKFDEKDIKQAYVDYYNEVCSFNSLCRRINIDLDTLKKYFAMITYRLQLQDEEEQRRKYLLEQEKNGKRETDTTV